jgi:hypothetical protein
MATNFWESDAVVKSENQWWSKDPEAGAAKKEESGFLRQVADVPLSIGRGAATGVRLIADAFGAGSGVSETIKGAEGYLASLMSAQAKNDEREIARIMKDAEDKGVGEQVKAAFQAFATAPVDLISQGLGTAAPAIVGLLGGKVLGAGALGARAIGMGVGAGMGAGTAKSAIYEATKEELIKAGLPEAQAEERAQLAQSYGGKNLDQILLSTGLGAFASGTGLESSIKNIIFKAGAKDAAQEVAKKGALQTAKNLTGKAALEGLPEIAQGSQEQLAQNIALQREGFDVPTMRGVAGAGALEGLAGAGLGVAGGAFESSARSQARAEAKRILEEEDKARAAAEQAEAKRLADAERARIEAEAAEKAAIPPLALGSEGVFTPVALPDGSVAMTREDLAQYEESQFQKKYAPQEGEKPYAPAPSLTGTDMATLLAKRPGEGGMEDLIASRRIAEEDARVEEMRRARVFPEGELDKQNILRTDRDAGLMTGAAERRAEREAAEKKEEQRLARVASQEEKARIARLGGIESPLVSAGRERFTEAARLEEEAAAKRAADEKKAAEAEAKAARLPAPAGLSQAMTGAPAGGELATMLRTKREEQEAKAEIPLVDNYPFLLAEKRRLEAEPKTPQSAQMISRINERLDSIVLDDVNRMKKELAATEKAKKDQERQAASEAKMAKQSIFAQEPIPEMESRDVIFGNEALADLQAPTLPGQELSREEASALTKEKRATFGKPYKTPEEDRLEQAEMDRRKFARSKESKSGTLMDALKGKLSIDAVSDIGGRRGRGYESLVAPKGKTGSSLEDLVDAGELDSFLPPDERVGMSNFDSQNASNKLRDMLSADKQTPTFDVQVARRGQDDAISALESDVAAVKEPAVVQAEVSGIEPGEAATVERAAGDQAVAETVGDIRYKRATGKIGIGKQAVQDIVDAVKSRWANAPEVVVAESMDDPVIPQEVRDHNREAVAKGAKGSPQGFYYKGKAYIIADSIGSTNDAVEALMHEALGHFGLRGVFGPKMEAVLRDVIKNRRAEVEGKAEQYGLDPKSDKDMLEAAEEVLAVMAQTKPGLPFVKRALVIIRDFLRSLGFNIKMSDADIIQKYILPARAFVESGKGRTTEGKPAAARDAGAGNQIYKDAGAIAAMDEDVRDNMEVGQVPGGSEAYNLYEAKKLLKKPSDKLKRVTDSNSFSLWQDWDYIANVDGEYFGVSKEEDPDATDDEDAFVFSYARLDDPRNVKTTYTSDVGVLMSDIRADSMGGKPSAMRGEAPKTGPGSAAFDRWFGDSKVVDADGNPAVVYHKTRADIKAFDKEKIGSSDYGYAGQGFYFMPFPLQGDTYGNITMPVFLSLQNPFVINDSNWKSEESPYGWIPANAERLGGNKEASKAWTEMMKSKGFDGFMDKTGKGDGEIVAFEPTQIKSATGNVGTYDPKKADIRYSRQNIKGQPVLAQWTTPNDTKLYGETNKDDIIYSLQNKMIDTKRVVDAISASAGKIMAKWNPYLQEELFHGRTAKQTADFLKKELRPLMQDMSTRGVNIKDFEEYLHNRHAEDYNKHVAKIGGMSDGGSGIDTADARAYLAGLTPQQKTDFEALAKKMDAINKATREVLVSSGYETRQTINQWEKTFPFYVPLKRDEAKLDYAYTAGGLGTGQGFDVRGKFSRSATGSEKDVVNILANSALQRERAIIKAEKNRVAQAMFGLALQSPNPDFWLPIDPMAEIDPSAAQDLLSFGLSQQDLDFLMKEPRQKAVDKSSGQVVERINATLRNNENVMSMRFNGRDRYVFFNPNNPRSKRMISSLKNLDADQLGPILGNLSKITRWFASVNTQYNPIFGAYNFLRDVQGATLQLSDTPLAKDRKAVVAGTLPALKGIYSALRAERDGTTVSTPWATLWNEFQEEGGQTGFRDQFSRSQERAEALEKELKMVTEGKLKSAGRGMLNWLSDYNDSMENAVRLSAYKAALDRGIDKQEAASIAKNLTVNFNRKGQIAVQAGALYAFFNAAVQGTTRLAQTLRGPAGKKIMAGGLLLGTMQAALLAAAGFDDEEPPEFVRERNLILPIGGDKYLTFPMPLGYHVIPSTSRIITEWALSGFKDTPDRIASLTGMYLEAFNPIGNAGWSAQTLAPTFADPIVALTENRDWTGKPIARKDFSSLDPTPGYTRAKDTASWFSTQLAKYLNYASGGTEFKPGTLSPTPDQIDYLIGQVTGGLGREALKVEQTITKTATGEELPPYKIPVVGRFYGETKSSAAESSRFYKNLTELNEHENEIKGRRESRQPVADYLKDNPEARLAPLARNTYSDIQKLRKRKEQLLERDAPRESIKQVEAMITKKMQAFNARVEAMKE